MFAGTFTLEAVLDVCVTDAIGDDDAIAAFSALVDKSLVTFADASRTRYLLLETIRAYAISAAQRATTSTRFDAVSPCITSRWPRI